MSGPVPVPNPPTPFDMKEFMHTTASFDLKKVFQMVEALPSIPRHVSSARPGGEARREILKGRAQNISRSTCETFAFCTSRTLSAEDTAIVLETFANVR
jgi:hypothetical protein